LPILSDAQSVEALALAEAVPPVVLLDEPTCDLDDEDRPNFDRALRRIAAHGAAALIATRSLAVATAHCGRVALLERGCMLAEAPVSDLCGLVEREFYRIRVAGRLEPHWSDWLGGLRMSYTGRDAAETLLTGPLADQGALHGVLAKLRDLTAPLLAVQRVEVALDP
jgi:ABC-type multidrug transport system ATPase subunit